MQNNKHHMRAAALISALFITAMSAMLAIAIAVGERLLIHNTALILDSDQAYLDLQGIQDWAIAAITLYEKQINTKSKTSKNKLITIFPTRKFKNVLLTGRIIDQQGLYNINDLANSENQSKFIRFLQAIDPKISSPQAFDLARAVTAWLTANTNIDHYYLQLKPPYRAAHQPMVHISELRAVRGFSAELMRELRPYIAAYPIQGNNSAININTALVPVLLTLSPKMTLQQAKALVVCRNEHGPFNDINQFNSLCGKRFKLPSLQHVVTNSHFFIVKGFAKIANHEMCLTSLLMATADKKNTIHIKIVWQAFS